MATVEELKARILDISDKVDGLNTLFDDVRARVIALQQNGATPSQLVELADMLDAARAKVMETDAENRPFDESLPPTP